MRHTGKVKFFNTTKGYGFITPEDGSKDVFVHITAVQAAGIPELTDGTKLSYSRLGTPSGPDWRLRSKYCIVEIQVLDSMRNLESNVPA